MYRSQSGEYTCKVSNEHGKEEIKMYINVVYEPEGESEEI